MKWTVEKASIEVNDKLVMVERQSWDGKYVANVSRWNCKEGYQHLGVIVGNSFEEIQGMVKKYFEEGSM